MNKINLFNNDWEFKKIKNGEENNENDIYQKISIPHDFLIYDVNNLYENCMAVYRKKFYVENFDYNNQNVFLYFEGVYMDSIVYVNGKKAKEWKYGYSSFEVNITEFVNCVENVVEVTINHQAPNSRWYSGAGIYRDVYLIVTDKDYIKKDSVYISTKKLLDNKWTTYVSSEVVAENLEELTLEYTIFDKNKKIVGNKNVEDCSNCESEIDILNPDIWDINTPENMYTLEVKLKKLDNVIYSEECKFGYREFELDCDEGLILNGRKLKIFGACQHHDLGALGAAVNKVALKRQMLLLKEMGVNAIRTAHNMPCKHLMNLADELGILICSEAFDIWRKSKNKYDYARFFDDSYELDVESWVKRDRNHPSLIMWSIGNEIYDTHADEDGKNTTQKLMDTVHKYDYRNNALVTIGSNYMAWENAQKCADIVKIAGYNYGEAMYEMHHKKYNDWVIYGSETCSVVQSRGIYHFPLSQSVLADDDLQCSALGNSSTSWGAESTEKCIINDRDTKFSLGQFIWTGTDYIGEPTPYKTKNSYFGQIDTAGFKKDSFYIFQAEWTDYKLKPMVHVFPYWDFSDNQMIDVRVCSNAPKVELFLDDISCGKFDINHENGEKLVMNYKIPYKKGELKAVAFDEFDNIIANDIKKSFGDASEIVLSADKYEINADGEDLIFVEISMNDECGNHVYNANNRVYVTVEGVGRLVGIDSGNSTDYDEYKGNSKKLFSGKLLAIIASTFESGDIVVNVESEGLESKSIILKSIESEIVCGVSSTFEENAIVDYCNEIPIRKIELVVDKNILDKNNRETNIVAKIYPSNATYSELEWRVTDARGIDSIVANIEVNGNSAKISAISDGEVYVRCCAKNGSNHIEIISQINLEIVGIGQAFINPYEFVSGGLYTYSNIRLTNGNERGVATSRVEESHVCFENIDFLEIGADVITIPIFALEPTEFELEIWEGIPKESCSELLGVFVYKSGSKWNTYIPETYKLNRRITGKTTLSFVVNRKIHIKGFVFEKIEKAFEKLNVVKDNSIIYGDSFDIMDDYIKDIGNNVSIVFDDMDFGERGTNSCIIKGRTPLEKTSIQIRFKNEHEEKIQLVEFNKSDDLMECVFDIEKIVGMNTVTFVFMPGVKFDFEWFKFNKVL